METINILDLDMLRIIASSCPFLKEVVFIESVSEWTWNSTERVWEPSGKRFKKDVSEKDLISVFSGWPKVKKKLLNDRVFFQIVIFK